MHKLESRYHYNKNLYMINNAEDIVVFQFKMFISDHYFMFSCSRNVKKPQLKIIVFKVINIDI